MIDLAEVLLALNIFSYAIYAPYTKVEESFNMQACHDMLTYGFNSKSLLEWDHQQFPGVVPRTFLGAIILSGLSFLPARLLTYMNLDSGFNLQLLVRLVLGTINASALIYLKRSIGRVHGKTAECFFIALQGTQFHIMYYSSRTLPNFLAFPLTTIATAWLVQSSIYSAIAILTVATVILRSEILILLGSLVAWHLFYSQKVRIVKTMETGLIAGLFSLLFSGSVDSYLWNTAMVPELTGFIYNVLHGKSSDWGTSPWFQYCFDIIKLCLNPLSLPLIMYGIYTNRKTLDLVLPTIGFLSIYSLQPHKEWRFIVYVVPGLTYCASLGAAHLFTRRGKTLLHKVLTIALLGSILLTGLLSHGMGLVSSTNYAGGQMMARIPQTSGLVYLDVLTCMTGSTLFLQDAGTRYTRTEDDGELNRVAFWDTLSYASVGDVSMIRSNDDRWQIKDRVVGFDGIDFRRLSLRKTIKLYLMENVKSTTPS